jgi:type II secretory pathway component PulF
MLLAIVGATSLVVIVGVVLPRFAAIIAGVGGTTPPLARAIIAAAGFARGIAVPVLVCVIGFAILWQVWMSEPAARGKFHRALLATPVIGSMRLTAASSRLCATLAALLDAGVAVAAALGHSAGASGDGEIERRVLEAREQVIAGARLSASLAKEGAVTPTAARLIRAGEESGQLSQMLERAASLDVARLNDALRALVRILEPLMIVSFAAVIAVVCGALLQTVYAVRP